MESLVNVSTLRALDCNDEVTVQYDAEQRRKKERKKKKAQPGSFAMTDKHMLPLSIETVSLSWMQVAKIAFYSTRFCAGVYIFR